jgi:cytochrome c oxidase subunit 1
MYLAFALVAALTGLVLFFALRAELAVPGVHVFADAQSINLLGGGFGLIMVFFVIMPAMIGGFGNLFVPPMIGARETAFPLLNAVSFWLLVLSFFLFVFSLAGTGGPGMELSVAALMAAGMAAVLGAINLVTTILNMRRETALHDMPLFVWSILVTAFLILVALPVFAGAATMVLTEGPFRQNFLDPAAHPDPLLEQHLFWFFGHPEIYMLVLPGFGMISQIVATFARRPVFGRLTIAYAMVATGFLGFVVWAHHLYAIGLAIDTTAYFVFTTMIVAAPVAVMIVSWVGTIWRGASFRAPMLWATGFIALFTLAGITAVLLATSGIDTLPERETYVVAHFHYVVSLGGVFGIFAGWYYWFPKITGLLYNETLAKLHFWLSFAGVTLSFFPFSVLALAGLGSGAREFGADVAVLGASCSAAGIIAFLMGMAEAVLRRRVAGENPWGAGATTREWSLHLDFGETRGLAQAE